MQIFNQTPGLSIINTLTYVTLLTKITNSTVASIGGFANSVIFTATDTYSCKTIKASGKYVSEYKFFNNTFYYKRNSGLL